MEFWRYYRLSVVLLIVWSYLLSLLGGIASRVPDRLGFMRRDAGLDWVALPIVVAAAEHYLALSVACFD